MFFVGKVPLLRSSKNVWKQLTQGLRPGLCRSIAPLGLTHAYVMCNPKWICGCLVGSGRGKKCRRHDTPAKPRVARVPKARTEPWVYTDRSGLSSVGAALTARVCFNALALTSVSSLGSVCFHAYADQSPVRRLGRAVTFCLQPQASPP